MLLSIEITKDQHQRLKAAAALQGQSIIKRTLPVQDEQAALEKLEKFLEPRIEAAE